MLARRRPAARRRGMTIVESALVITVFLMLLFGIFEYARFLMVLHVTSNAARDAARYAAVNLDKSTNFDTVNDSVSGRDSITKYTTDKMGGVNKQLTGFTIEVFAVDPASLATNPADPQRKGTANWNEVTFPDKVGVKLKGRYIPFLPSFLKMEPEIPITITSVTGGES
jgi:Flp pilus assembly protein TadG